MEQLKDFVPETNLRDMIWFCSVGLEENKIHISFLINFVDWIESEENKMKALEILHSLYQVDNRLYDACWFRFKQNCLQFVNSEQESIFEFSPLSGHHSPSSIIQGQSSITLMKVLFSVA